MPQLETLSASASQGSILELIKRDGACIVENAMSSKLLSTIRSELEPFITDTEMGRDDFTGEQTQRTGALVARSPACCEAVINENILMLAREFLKPYSRKLILNTTQAITINPGEGEQALHRDRFAWGKNIPKEIETQLSTIWALTEFSNTNGATRLVPGSHLWDWNRQATPDEICQAEMAPGSVLIFTGSVIHSGGPNNSSHRRIGLNITYCLGWLRQEENQYLSCPPEFAKTLDPVLQDLLGYTQGDYALGYYSAPVPGDQTSAGILPPEFAIDKKPENSSRNL
jgi:ectoine hydroxylase-related dioxygenase (phytanoyl-CoA dioxygenase family)